MLSSCITLLPSESTPGPDNIPADALTNSRKKFNPPKTSYVHIEPLPKQSKNRVNPVVVAVALLKCFNDGQQGCQPFAPWAWSAPKKDTTFAREVVQSLRIIGAREELCKIGISRPKDVERADEKWAEILSGLKDHSKPLPPPSTLSVPATPIERSVKVDAAGNGNQGT
jgi:hypothetical protein